MSKIDLGSVKGNGIASVVQTTTSTESNGDNIITVTLDDGTTSTFKVKNGTNVSIIDNLSTQDSEAALTANQGYALNNKIDTLSTSLGTIKSAAITSNLSTLTINHYSCYYNDIFAIIAVNFTLSDTATAWVNWMTLDIPNNLITKYIETYWDKNFYVQNKNISGNTTSAGTYAFEVIVPFENKITA